MKPKNVVTQEFMNKGNLIPLGFLILLLVFFGCINVRFLTLFNFLTLLKQSSILLIVSLGVSYVLLMGSIDLSIGSTITLAGIVTALLINDVGWWILLIAPIVGLLVGIFNGFIFVYLKIPSFITTLSSMSILYGLGLIISDGTPIPIRNNDFINLANGTLIGGIPNIFLIAILCYVVCIFIQFKTKFGRYIFAIGGNERVAELSGILVKKYKMITFLINGFILGLAGLLLASRVGSSSSSMGDSFMMESIAATVMGGTALSGGTGGVHKNIIGVAVIAVLSNGMNVGGIHPYIQTLIKGFIIILAVIFSLNQSKVETVK
jgi:ribose transport system permease protein